MADHRMSERELYQLFERLQMCVDQLRVMQNLQEKEHHNLHRSILKLDKQVGFLSGQLAAKRVGAPAGRRAGDGKAGKSGRPPAGDDTDETKRRSGGEELSSGDTDSSHAEAAERGGSPPLKKGRRSRRQRRSKRSAESRAPAVPSGLSDEPLVPTWSGPSVGSFDELRLAPDLMTGIQASPSGEREPTAYQRAVLPALLSGADVVVQARGPGADYGKHAAIALAVLDKVSPQMKACQALVLTSSREAAKRIHRELVGLATFIRPRLTCHLSVGGASIRDDLRDMSAGCHLVVGTLGRAFDMLRRGALKTTDLRLLVLDDIDTMMTRRFDKDHIYAVLGDVTSEAARRIQMVFLLSMMHEDIPKAVTLFAEPPVCKVLVESERAETSCREVTTTTGKLDEAVQKLAQKLGEVVLPEVTVQPPLPEAMAQGVVEG